MNPTPVSIGLASSGASPRVLSVAGYDAAEAFAKRTLSYVELSAFATSTFAHFNFPSTVTHEEELARYCDWNNSTSNYEYFKPNHFVPGPSVHTAFTERERELAHSLSDRVATMTGRLFGREMRPISALLAQFGLFRAVMQLQRHSDKPLSVFEVGPGNGYLGALLIEAGLSYASVDNSQALYLWQNRVFAECADDSFCEWVGSRTRAGRVQHLPWWDYLGLRHDCPLKADVFISNTNLGEMNYGALQFTTRIARRILADSPLGAFMFTNIGDAKQNTMATVEGELAAAGFGKVCKKLLHAYVPATNRAPRALSDLDSAIPHYSPDGSAPRYKARDILKVTADTLPNDVDFLSFVGTFDPKSQGII